MNGLTKRLAEMTDSERFRMLCWIARQYPAVVEGALLAQAARPLENAAITWRISEPAEPGVPPACHPGELLVPPQDPERAGECASAYQAGGTQ